MDEDLIHVDHVLRNMDFNIFQFAQRPIKKPARIGKTGAICIRVKHTRQKPGESQKIPNDYTRARKIKTREQISPLPGLTCLLLVYLIS